MHLIVVMMHVQEGSKIKRLKLLLYLPHKLLLDNEHVCPLCFFCFFLGPVKCLLLSSGSLWGRVEEQSFWSSQILGEQSPTALLRSLVYLNTKYFGLHTVEQHLRLSFANVYGPDTVHPVTKKTIICIRVPPTSQDHHGESFYEI